MTEGKVRKINNAFSGLGFDPEKGVGGGDLYWSVVEGRWGHGG